MKFGSALSLAVHFMVTLVIDLFAYVTKLIKNYPNTNRLVY